MIQRLRATPPKLEAFLQARPHLRQAAWGALDSAPASYTDLCYSTSVASLFQSSPSEDHSPTAASERLCQAEDCESGMTAPATLAGSSEHQGYYARYRLVSEAVLESGNLRRFGVAPKEVVGFPETFPREAEDARPQDYLGKELLARVLADGGHKYILQVRHGLRKRPCCNSLLDGCCTVDSYLKLWQKI